MGTVEPTSNSKNELDLSPPLRLPPSPSLDDASEALPLGFHARRTLRPPTTSQTSRLHRSRQPPLSSIEAQVRSRALGRRKEGGEKGSKLTLSFLPFKSIGHLLLDSLSTDLNFNKFAMDRPLAGYTSQGYVSHPKLPGEHVKVTLIKPSELFSSFPLFLSSSTLSSLSCARLVSRTTHEPHGSLRRQTSR